MLELTNWKQKCNKKGLCQCEKLQDWGERCDCSGGKQSHNLLCRLYTILSWHFDKSFLKFDHTWVWKLQDVVWLVLYLV